MSKNNVLDNMAEEEVLWHDRKRILGMPISFTVYEVDTSRFTCRKGLLNTTTDEMLLYRILDLKMTRSLGQKIFGVGSITLYTADQSHQTLEIKNIRQPEKVRKFLSRIVEQQRNAKGITGREMFGAAGLVNGDDGDGDAGFLDLDGDGTMDI